MLDFRFLLRTDRHQCEGRGLDRVVEEACGAGLRALCLGELDLSPQYRWHLADKISAVCRRYGTHLFLMDRADLAVAVHAHGVILTPDSLPIAAARTAMPGGTMGLMLSRSEQIPATAADPPDFFLYGPVFERFEMQNPSSPNRLKELTEVAAMTEVPVFAFGGVTPLNVPRCLEAGAYGVSMLSMVMSSPNVGLLIEAYDRALGRL